MSWQREASGRPASCSPRRTGRSTRRPATSSATSSSTRSSPPSWSSSTTPTGSRTASTASPTASARRPLRHRHRRLADLPLRPAPRRRDLGAARRRASLGAALAAGRSGAARRRPRHARRPGQRQAPRPDRGRRRRRPRRSCSSWPAASEQVRAHIDGREVVKEIVVPGQARQPGRPLTRDRVMRRVHIGGTTAAEGLLESARCSSGASPTPPSRSSTGSARTSSWMRASSARAT